MKKISTKKVRLRLDSAGVTMMELLVATLILSVVMILSFALLGKMRNATQNALISSTNESDINQLVQQLVKMARMGTNCQKVIVPNPYSEAIQCDLKTGNLTTRLHYVKPMNQNLIRFEHWNGANWVTRQTFGGTGDYFIKQFNICNTSDMIVTPPSCPIYPATLSSAYLNAMIANSSPGIGYYGIAPTLLTDRFFRFQIVASDGPDKPEYRIQSAIFVRNPAPNGVTYTYWH